MGDTITADSELAALRHHETCHALHATDANGKKLFPSAESRKAEVDSRMARFLHPRSTIEYRVVNVYGQEKRYFADPDGSTERAIRKLTGRTTITDGDFEAILAMGFGFSRVF